MVKRLILPLGVTALAYGLSGGLLAGCSLLINVDGKQCTTNEQCETLGAEFAGAECVSNVCVVKSGSGGSGGGPSDTIVCDPQETSKEPAVKYSFAPIYVVGSEPDEDTPFQISACLPADLDCAKPVFGPVDVNAGEPKDFFVPPGFQGYFYIKNPNTVDGLVFMGHPIVQDTVGWNVTIPTPQLVQGFGLATGETINPDLGLIISVARDCEAMPIQGVKFANSKEGLQFYFVNSFPDTSLKESGPQGAVGFANVPISTTTLSATTKTGQALREAIIRVKPRTASFVELFP
jgi:hypothetical protein